MKHLHKLFPLGHYLISLLFIGCGLALITFAGLQLWHGIQPSGKRALDQHLYPVLDSIAVLTMAVVAFELGQSILEEKVQREAQRRMPTPGHNASPNVAWPTAPLHYDQTTCISGGALCPTVVTYVLLCPMTTDLGPALVGLVL